ncbi:MAG: repeat-containing protein [Gemmataceae bacterium]|nr:repeat-containing protein [Gemmataceae bacterium]
MRFGVVAVVLLLAAGCRAPSTEDWLRQLKDSDVVKRREAIRELGARPGEAGSVVPALTEALGDESSYVRHDAATTLGKFGPDAKEAVPALTTALKDKDHSVRVAAGAALKRIDPQAAKNVGGMPARDAMHGRP